MKKDISLSGPKPAFFRISRREYRRHRQAAFLLALQRLELLNQIYNLQYQRLSIRCQKTRWGSCSRKGNLNFNYKIALLPARFADYILAHELCHLAEFNHSSRFWALVAKAVPDYKIIRRQLRRGEFVEV